MEYLSHLRAEADRLVAAARKAGPEAPVPTCPGWTVTALVEHVAEAYRHKIACMRLGRRPAAGDWPDLSPPGTEPIDWYLAALDDLVEELVSRGPDQPAYTWFPPDQTTGFWARRMAHETVVHRLDAEFAADAVSSVDPELAADGVDEMLRIFLGGPWWENEPVPEASGRAVVLRAGGHVWRVTLEPTVVTVDTTGGLADATIEGDATDLLLWTWGRPTVGTVTTGGEPSALDELRDRLARVSD